jgi:hypothetical protein
LALITNLVSYWPLNEASGTRSDLRTTNHLTDTNSPGTAAGLVYANASTFSEGNYSSLTIADNASLSTGDVSFALAVWVKLGSLVPYNHVFVSKIVPAPNTDDEYQIYKNGENGFVFQACATDGTANEVVVLPAGGLEQDVWYLIHGWHDATNNLIGVQVNAETAVTAAHSVGVRDGTNAFRVGGKDGSFDCTATIGPLMFWKGGIVSEADRTANYNSGAGRTYASLVTSYTVQAALGTFTLTGQSANLVPRTALYASTGTFTLTGQSANLGRGRKMVAERGTFALAGKDVLFDRSVAVQAPVTSVTRSASSSQRVIDISAEAIRLMGVEYTQPQPLFEFTGRTFKARVGDSAVYRPQDTVPVVPNHYMMTAGRGDFSLTGYDTFGVVVQDFSLLAERGTFTLSGQAAGLKRAKKMTAARGTFTLTGKDATLIYFAGNEGEFQTTGSISTTNPNQVVVVDPSIFAINDWVIVEVPEDIGRGEVGPGGTFPSLNRRYANAAAIQTACNNGTIPNNGRAWAADTGDMYWWINGNLFHMPTFFEGYWWEGKAVPRALQCRISGKSGNTLFLDLTTGSADAGNGGACITRSGLTVYNDRSKPITDAITAGNTLLLEAKDYPCGSRIRIDSKPGATLAGQGRDLTRIFAPRGTAIPTVDIRDSTNVTVRDLTLEGNLGMASEDGHGFNYAGLATPPTSFNGVDDNSFPNGFAQCQGILWSNNSHDGIGRRLRVRNVFAQSVGANFCNRLDVDDFIYEQDGTDRDYVGWKVNFSDADACRITNFSISCLLSTGAISGLESFKSTNSTFQDGVMHNAIAACNGSAYFLFNRITMTYDANCMVLGTGGEGQYPQRDHPCISINSNIDHFHPNNALGGTIQNVTITQSGYVNATNDTLVGIQINPRNQRVVVRDITYAAPNYSPVSGTTTRGARGLEASTELGLVGTTIQRITTTGTTLNVDPNVSVYVLRGLSNLGGHSVPAGQQVIFYGG